jgi:hypothetical protein
MSQGAESANTAEFAAHRGRVVFYTQIQLSPSVDDPRRLVFVAAPDSAKPPDDLVALRQDYARTARVVSVLFEDEQQTRKDIFLQLHAAADRGLRGPDFSIEDGRANLEAIREAITDSAIKVRDLRLREYTWLALFFGLVPLLMGAGVLITNGFGQLKPPPPNGAYDPVFIWILAALWIPAGAAVCVWGEFALRMQAGLSYEQLMSLDPSRWRPSQRLLITVGIAFIFAFLLAFRAVQVGVGNLLLNEFADKTPALALAVGGITGLAFVAVRDIIFRVKPTERN